MALAAALPGCASSLNTIDPASTGALSATGEAQEAAAAQPAQPSAFPAVHDVPPPRSNTTLSDYELRRLENELNAARSRVGKPAPAASRPDSATPQKAGGTGGS